MGQRVTYSMETGRNGKPQAINIVPEGGGGGGSAGGGGGGNPFAPLSAAAQSFQGPPGPNPFASSSLTAAPSPFGSGSPFGAAMGGSGLADPFSSSNNPFAAPKAAEWGTGSAFASLPATQSAFAGLSGAPTLFGGGNTSIGENPFGAAAAPAVVGGGSAFGMAPNPFTSTATPATRSAVAKAAATAGPQGGDAAAASAAPSGDGMTCPLTGTSLGQHNMTVAKLIKKLLATQTATEVSMKNVLKNQYGVTAKNSSLPLLADEYARTLLGSARSKAQQSSAEQQQQQESTPPSGKKAGGIGARLGASPGGAAGAAGGGVSSRMGTAFGEGEGGSPAAAAGGGGYDEPAFVRFKGLRTEEQVRGHFKRVDTLLPDPRKCGPFEYVTQVRTLFADFVLQPCAVSESVARPLGCVIRDWDPAAASGDVPLLTCTDCVTGWQRRARAQVPVADGGHERGSVRQEDPWGKGNGQAGGLGDNKGV